MKKQLKRLAVILGSLMGAVVGFCILVFHKMFRVHRDRDGRQIIDSSNAGTWLEARKNWLKKQDCEEIYLTSYDGLKLYGRLYRPKESAESGFANSRGTSAKKASVRGTIREDPASEEGEASQSNSPVIILSVHGYQADGPTDIAPFAPFFAKNGYIYCIVDDRAHGKSEGTYVGYAYQDKYDIKTWTEYLSRRFGSNCRIFLHGLSMGGAAVLSCASMDDLPPQVKGIISDCAFTNGWDEAVYVARLYLHLPKFPFLYIFDGICKLRLGFRLKDASPIDSVRASKLPILFIHGDADRFVPTRMGFQLYYACRGHKQLFIVHGASHIHAYRKDPSGYEKVFTEFVDRWSQT